MADVYQEMAYDGLTQDYLLVLKRNTQLEKDVGELMRENCILREMYELTQKELNDEKIK